MLKLRFGLDVGEAGSRGNHVRLSLRQLGAVIPIVDPEEDIACLDGLVVLDFDRGHIARHPWRNGRDVTPDVGVVRIGLGARLEPLPSGDGRDHGRHSEKRADDLLQLRRRHDPDSGNARYH